MASIVEPTYNSTRSELVDWLELVALTSPRHHAVEADVIGLRELNTGTEDEVSADATNDEAILETEQEIQLQSLANEIAHRKDILGGAYPFDSGTNGTLLIFDSTTELTHGQWVYLFCLLSSAITNGYMQPIESLTELAQKVPILFQACACVSAAGFLSGAVSSFGFPRATGERFILALKSTVTRLGEGRVSDNPQVPDTLAAAIKDGGIDVIAWKEFPDKMPGKIYLVGQCASGKHWRDKSVVEYLNQFHGAWFAPPPPSQPIPAMFIPFAFHQDQQENAAQRFEENTHLRLQYDTTRFGIIHDRFRVAHYAGIGFSGVGVITDTVDGFTQFANVCQWVQDVRAAITVAPA
jgi:hypothetical protein